MDEREQLARAVRDACARIAAEAYEDAGTRGLCAEGRWEYALDAIRSLDPLRALEKGRGSARGSGGRGGER